MTEIESLALNHIHVLAFLCVSVPPWFLCHRGIDHETYSTSCIARGSAGRALLLTSKIIAEAALLPGARREAERGARHGPARRQRSCRRSRFGDKVFSPIAERGRGRPADRVRAARDGAVSSTSCARTAPLVYNTRPNWHDRPCPSAKETYPEDIHGTIRKHGREGPSLRRDLGRRRGREKRAVEPCPDWARAPVLPLKSPVVDEAIASSSAEEGAGDQPQGLSRRQRRRRI